MGHIITSPIVICFYTLDTPYEQEVLNLITSCKKWGVELLAQGKKSQGSWAANCNLKPAFILEKLQEFKRPVFWADADSVFLQKPDFTPFLSCDFSVRAMEVFQADPRFHLNTASVFVNYTEEAITLMEKWSRKCSGNAPYLDQIALEEVLSESKTLRTLPMPIAYCKVYDLDQFFLNDEDVVIEQTQASRRYKHLLS